MKTFIISFVCGILCCSAVSAQSYRAGEAIVKDGIPCIVIDTDESGQHGLVMTLTPNYKALKDAKKTNEYKWFYQSKKLKGRDNKLQKEYVAELYNRTKCDSVRVRTSGISTALRLSTSLSGKENMANVIAYCNEKGIEMEAYFHPEYWAQSLGKEWYIPGVDELEKYIKIFGFETFGYKHSLGITKYAKANKAALDNFFQSITKLAELGEDTAPFKDAELYNAKNIWSSTIANEGKNAHNLSLIAMYQKMTGKQWFDMFLGGGVVCAVSEF